MTKIKQLTFDELEKVDSKISEVKGSYKLPENWKWVRIKDVAQEIKSGFACSKSNEVEEGIPHLRPHNIGLGKLELSNIVYLPPEIVDLKTYSLRKGDILFNNTNSKELVGRAALVTEDLECGFSNHITRIRVKKELILPEFLTYAINYLWLSGYFLEICTKWIGQAGVNNQKLKSTKIPLPPLEEQKRIVAKIEELFSKIDRIKELRRQAKEQAENLLKAALHHVFSRADEKGWKWVRLKEIAVINPPKSEIKNLSPDLEVSFIPMEYVDDVTGKIVKQEKKKLFEVKQGYTYFREGDVLFAKITPCMENGKFAVARGLINGIGFGSTEFHVIRPMVNFATSEWIWFYLRQEKIRNEATKYFTGSVGQQRVPKEFLERLEIPLPSLEEQKRIAAYLDKIAEKQRKLLELYERTERELEELKNAILDKAFRGQL